jgi:hypothetical protein
MKEEVEKEKPANFVEWGEFLGDSIQERKTPTG